MSAQPREIGTRRVPARRAEERVEQLYEISKLFLALESIEQTFDAVLRVVEEALPLRSAILLEVRCRHKRMILWPNPAAGGVSPEAKAHVQRAHAYLAGGDVDVEAEATGAPTSAGGPDGDQSPPGDFVVIPLVRRNREIVGALQFEGLGALAKGDVAFASAIANQLTIALERDGA
jgi:hypothetical protein